MDDEGGPGELEYEVDYESPEPEESAAEDGGKKFLEYARALGPPFAASVTALTIALIGFFGNRALKEHDKTNLYADLISRREEAESGLRKDMFESMTEQFFKSREERENGDGDDGQVDYSKRLLQLEMLALNFGESITMGPLFHELSSEIRGAYEAREISFVDRQFWLHRLEKLARKVASWQLAALSRPGDEDDHVRELVVLPAEWAGGRFSWPREDNQDAAASFAASFEDGAEASFAASFEDGAEASFAESFADDAAAAFAASFEQDPFETGTESDVGLPEDEPSIPAPRASPEAIPDGGGGLAPPRYEPLTLDGVEREVRILLSEPDHDLKTVEARVFVKAFEEVDDFGFTLDFFDFPMIDSIRLSHGHRLALVLNAFDDDKTQVTCVLFHSMYGSQRDKPFLDVVIDQMPRVVDAD